MYERSVSTLVFLPYRYFFARRLDEAIGMILYDQHRLSKCYFCNLSILDDDDDDGFI